MVWVSAIDQIVPPCHVYAREMPPPKRPFINPMRRFPRQANINYKKIIMSKANGLCLDSHPLCLRLVVIIAFIAISVAKWPFTAALVFSGVSFHSAVPRISVAIRERTLNRDLPSL